MEDYIRSIEQWRDASGRTKQFEVSGQLIGSLGMASYKSNVKVQRLENRIQNFAAAAKWKVRDIEDVLSQTKVVHKQLITTFEMAQKSDR